MKTILVDAVYTFVDEEGNIFEDVHKLLEEYPNRKILLTNADYEATNKYKLIEMPYEVFTLKHNPKKVDSAYFQKMLENFNLNKDNVVYFEHSAEAIKAAESVGIKSYLFDTEKREIAELKQFLNANLGV